MDKKVIKLIKLSCQIDHINIFAEHNLLYSSMLTRLKIYIIPSRPKLKRVRKIVSYIKAQNVLSSKNLEKLLVATYNTNVIFYITLLK